jgi:hypothetical protein
MTWLNAKPPEHRYVKFRRRIKPWKTNKKIGGESAMHRNNACM